MTYPLPPASCASFPVCGKKICPCLDIPSFLVISEEDRRASWIKNPPKPWPSELFKYQPSEAELAYRAQVRAEQQDRMARARAARDANAEVRKKERDEMRAVQEAVKQTKRELKEMSGKTVKRKKVICEPTPTRTQSRQNDMSEFERLQALTKGLKGGSM